MQGGRSCKSTSAASGRASATLAGGAQPSAHGIPCGAECACLGSCPSSPLCPNITTCPIRQLCLSSPFCPDSPHAAGLCSNEAARALRSCSARKEQLQAGCHRKRTRAGQHPAAEQKRGQQGACARCTEPADSCRIQLGWIPWKSSAHSCPAFGTWSVCQASCAANCENRLRQ